MSLDRITEALIARQPPEAQAIIRVLLAQIAALQAEVATLKSEVARLKKTPQNSSLPPSTQHPHARLPRQHKSQKKRGGQPGHAQHQRPLIPTKQCDDVQSLKPAECRRCGGELSGSDRSRCDIKCGNCPRSSHTLQNTGGIDWRVGVAAKRSCAELPPGVPLGQSGPRLVAFTALLMAYFRQSKRRTALFLEAILNQPCCPALTVKMQTQVTAAVRGAYEELAAQLPSEGQLSIDESPTKEQTSKAWLWVFVARSFTVFALRTTRAATVLDRLVTIAFGGIVNCDRAKMYWQCGRLQWCWAHLKRDFQALIDADDGQAKRLGHDLMRPTCELFRHWSRCRDGTITRLGFERSVQPIRREVDGLLLRGMCCGNERLVGMCRELYDHRAWLWTFVDHAGIEPTNNLSERALRHGVIWRKLSFGTQSAGGSRFVETMLTVIETCRQQRRPVFGYLTEAVAAHFQRTPCPSLLPRV